jgi:6-phosphogluconate dehydrogenase (decarboxylating)
MLQAIGEGVDLLSRSDYELDLPALFHNWSHGSVIRGWFVELTERALREHDLDLLSGLTPMNKLLQRGQTVAAARANSPTPAIAASRCEIGLHAVLKLLE